MKIIILFPQVSADKFATLGQNRQFQYFKDPTFIYPIVPAYMATTLKNNGHDVIWLDCISEDISIYKMYSIIKKENPDFILIETKTPVIKKEWNIVNKIKNISTAKIILYGDHVTALPKDSIDKGVDYILTGGDYDIIFPKIIDNIESLNTKIIDCCANNIESIPHINRRLTKWENYAYKNGNYRELPGTYIMSARDCWWGKCTFCSWTQLYKKYKTKTPYSVICEIHELVTKYKIKEIMDDSGSFPIGEWLKEFCDMMIFYGLNKKVKINCNMRFGILSYDEYKLMKKAGFRMVLFGIESANDETLKKINKGITAKQILNSCKLARKAGLYPHITVMFGYPWETNKDIDNTYKFIRELLLKGYAYTMQATIITPYPGTQLFKELSEQNLIKTYDWSKYDMEHEIIKNVDYKYINETISKLYKTSFSFRFLFGKILSIRNHSDIKFFMRILKKVLSHAKR